MGAPPLLIRHHMREVLVTFTRDMDVLRAIHLLLEKGVSGAPVVDRLGNIVGFLSERDAMAIALDASYYEDAAGTVERFMSKKVVTVDAEDSIISAARIFHDAPYKTLPVMVDNRLAGMLTRRDVLRSFERHR
ncbi:transcriptional regulator [Salinisphaera orenii MK-B5]|uniref:Transcriptional regulator n=2 Tax=Salinisphaera orenii TaxID=856731 RepID=A0A423PRU8_9GAMM|nr:MULTISPECIES: CBS domain-containing protein [Salinisphaera]ROO28339.1 transcriptional regulator [Salinisphaera orenii MK-B5]ROO32442.1 transcriptional regulator [Salinisphaera halophila YIM 95161]